MEWSSIGGSKNELVADGLLGSAGGEERSRKARGYSGLGHSGRAGRDKPEEHRTLVSSTHFQWRH